MAESHITSLDVINLTVNGSQVAKGTQRPLISDPVGGTTIDEEARAAINAIIDALQAFGIVALS